MCGWCSSLLSDPAPLLDVFAAVMKPDTFANMFLQIQGCSHTVRERFQHIFKAFYLPRNKNNLLLVSANRGGTLLRLVTKKFNLPVSVFIAVIKYLSLLVMAPRSVFWESVCSAA